MGSVSDGYIQLVGSFFSSFVRIIWGHNIPIPSVIEVQ